jgi:Ca2+-binding EF-hand superfamily protein
MKTLLICGAAAAALVTATAIAQAPQAPAPIARNVLTRAEVQGRVSRHFAKLDANRDGFVTKAEADAMNAQRMQKRSAKRAERRSTRFDRIDANHDGSISHAEFAAKQARHQQRVAARDRNGDGRPDRGMRRMNRGIGGGFGGRMFAMADVNHDARISMEEATAVALRHFDMADGNRDGQVSRDERRHMRQQMRSQHRQTAG